MIWVETPTNPLLNLADIAAIGALRTAKHRIVLVVDNTFASPYFQQPLALGADVVVHSTTKYIGGHSDVVGGVAITNHRHLYDAIKFHQNAVGGVPGPHDAWLTMRGAKTLALRMREHARNAQAVAEFLEARDDVERVLYPGLPSHPQHELAKRQMSGFGGMVSFVLTGAPERALDFANRLTYFSLAESLGGVESLICHPARMTHGSIPEAERRRRGVDDRLLRLSVGIERHRGSDSRLARYAGRHARSGYFPVEAGALRRFAVDRVANSGNVVEHRVRFGGRDLPNAPGIRQHDAPFAVHPNVCVRLTRLKATTVRDRQPIGGHAVLERHLRLVFHQRAVQLRSGFVFVGRLEPLERSGIVAGHLQLNALLVFFAGVDDPRGDRGWIVGKRFNRNVPHADQIGRRRDAQLHPEIGIHVRIGRRRRARRGNLRAQAVR